MNVEEAHAIIRNINEQVVIACQLGGRGSLVTEFYFPDESFAASFWKALAVAETLLWAEVNGVTAPEPLLSPAAQSALDEALAKLDFPANPNPPDRL